MVRQAPASKTSTALPEQRTAEDDSTTDSRPAVHPVAAGRPVPFDRVLSVVSLTPAQASLLAEQLLDAAHRRGSPNGDHLPGGCLGAVTLTRSGDVDVAPPLPGDGTPVTALLEQLVRNARRLPAHPRPEQLLMLRRLEEAVREPLADPGARARDLERAMTEALGPRARQRLSQQLAGLVEALVLVTPDFRAGSGLPPPAVPAVQRAASASAGSSRSTADRVVPPSATSRPPRRRTLLQRRTRGRRVAVGVLVLATALAVSGYVVLRDPNSRVATSLGLGSHPTAPATTAPPHHSKKPVTRPRPHRPAAVPTVAARHAGAVTGVVVQKTGSCRPGSLCPVKVTVHLRPVAATRPVAWRVGSARLCKRAIAWAPPTTMTAQPGWSTVFASSSVRVPKGHPQALIAVTTTPARAQSRPTPVAGASLRC